MSQSPELLVRRANAGDIEALARLLTVLFSIEADFRPDPDRQRRGLRAMLDAPDQRCVLVAERGGAVIGMVTAQLLISTAEGAPSAVVEDMVVEEAAQGQGVGRLLLHSIENWARDRGATRLQLLADRENAPALGFYERMGWRPTQLVCWRRGGIAT
jgi:GNAT superfamily N-acetyltransferase